MAAQGQNLYADRWCSERCIPLFILEVAYKVSKGRENQSNKHADDKVNDDIWAIRLGFGIHDTSRLRRVIFDSRLKPAGVTRSQAWVLAYLSREDGMAQSELAAQLDLGKVALGGLVDRLEAASLVERRLDPIDRRVKRIFLTREGRRVVKKQRKIAGALNAEIQAGVDPTDIEVTARTLRALKRNMLSMARAPAPD